MKWLFGAFLEGAPCPQTCPTSASLSPCHRLVQTHLPRRHLRTIPRRSPLSKPSVSAVPAPLREKNSLSPRHNLRHNSSDTAGTSEAGKKGKMASQSRALLGPSPQDCVLTPQSWSRSHPAPGLWLRTWLSIWPLPCLGTATVLSSYDVTSSSLSPWGGRYSWSHFTDAQTEAEISCLTCPK